MVHFPFLRKRKVLLVSHNLTISGAPLLLAETAAAIAKSGADVALVNLGLRDSEFPLPVCKGFRTIPVEHSLTLASQADLVIANTAVTKTWVRDFLALHPAAARKLVWWIHEIDTDLYAENMECVQAAAAVIFDSDSSYQQWRRTGLPMPLTTRVIHPCVHDDFLRAAIRLRRSSSWTSWRRQIFDGTHGSAREKVRAQLGVREEDFLVSLIGQYCSLKGHDLLVETIGKMLDASPGLPLKLLLVGFPDQHTRRGFLEGLSEAECAAVGPNRAVPLVADSKPYYLASDAFVMNTQHPGETFGRVTIEAMAFRLPILGTRVGGTGEIVIEGVTGLLHPAGKEGQTQLAENIRELMNDRRKAQALGEAGFKRVRVHFAEDRLYQELAEIVKRVLM